MSSGKGPDTDTVSSSSEEISYTTNFFKSRIFCENIPHLIHCCTPTESLVEMIKDFYGVCSSTFCEEFVNFFSKALGSTHAFASKLRLWTCCQALVLTSGLHAPEVSNPLACTNAPSFGFRGRLVAMSEAKVTMLFCCNFCCCMEMGNVGLPMKKSRSVQMNVNLVSTRSHLFFTFNLP